MYTTIIAQIETWDTTQIADAIASLKSDKALTTAIMARYDPLLTAINGKTLKALADLPTKWKKATNEKKVRIITAYPKDALFFTNIIYLDARLRVDTWRDSHYSNQITELPLEISKLKGVTELHLEHQEFKDLPAALGEMEDLEVLNLSDNKLRILPDFILKLKKLRVLNLNQNYSLSTIPDIGQLEQLEVIDFTYTDIKTLPEGFYELKNMKEITIFQCDLDRNTAIVRRLLQTFPDASIHTNARKAIELEDSISENEYEGKEIIKIDEYNLNYLPDSLFAANCVKKLEIKCWNLLALPDTFDKLQTLEELSLEIGNKVKELPASVFQLKNLKKLYLRGTGIEIVADCMEGLESLEYLEIDNLRVASLPPSFQKLKKLTTLIIKYGDYDVFEAIAPLTQLKTLKLDRYNTPFRIAAPLSLLTNLKEVELTFNQILTDDIYNLPKTLEKLILVDDCWGEKQSRLSLCKLLNHFNQLKTLETNKLNVSDISEVIAVNNHLETLCLDYSKLTELPDSIENLKKLKYVRMFNCELDFLNPALYNCLDLKHFRTSSSKFKTIPVGISKLTNLTELGFERGSIEVLPDEMFDMKQLKGLYLGDCALYNDKNFKTKIKRKIKGLRIVKSWYS